MKNTKLEQLFDLPTDEPPEEVVDNSAEDANDSAALPVSDETIDALDKIDAALPTVVSLEATDAELDELAELAKSSYKDLLDLGMNVEPRFASEILSTAGTFLGHAISARNSKINKKLKMIDLQMKKAKMDEARSIMMVIQ